MLVIIALDKMSNVTSVLRNRNSAWQSVKSILFIQCNMYYRRKHLLDEVFTITKISSDFLISFSIESEVSSVLFTVT